MEWGIGFLADAPGIIRAEKLRFSLGLVNIVFSRIVYNSSQKGGLLMENIILQTKKLTKKLGGVNVLEDVDITLYEKHIYGFIGENGAGKTTLMKILTGLSYQTSGSFSILGKWDKREKEEVRKCIGSTIESPALYSGYTVYQNLELQRVLIGNPDKNACDNVLKMVDLYDSRKKKVRTLSMGMKQRLSIALALIGKPRILILDEPVNGLDPKNISSLRKLLQRLNTERDLTIFVSSHILSELYLLATDYIIIHHGKIIDVLTHDELEAKCRKYICIRTNVVPLALTVLDREFGHPEYKVVSDTEIHLYSCLNKIESVSLAFMQNDIVVTEFSVSEQSLEEYFLNATGGGEHA